MSENGRRDIRGILKYSTNVSPAILTPQFYATTVTLLVQAVLEEARKWKSFTNDLQQLVIKTKW